MPRHHSAALFLLLLLLLAPSAMRADHARRLSSFSSANHRFELRQGTGTGSTATWSLINKSTGATRYTITGDLSPRTTLVSDDGRSLVVVDDSSDRRPRKDLDLLLFYRDGKLIRTVRMDELLRDSSNISSSVSHFKWFFGARQPLSISDGRLRLETFELVSYEFDIATGQTLRQQVDPILSPGAVYVYGELEKLGGNRYAVKVCQLAYGKLPPGGRVELEAVPGALPDRPGSWVSVVVKDRKVLRVLDVLLNSCNQERRAGKTASSNPR